jgi:glucose/arabinose dehydrogenase
LQNLNVSLSRPAHITHAGDGSGRLFIVEQAGKIQIYQGGSLRSTPFLDITGRVRGPGDTNAGPEEGLLSVAFPPGYNTKQHFYVYYTNSSGNNVVSRFNLSSENQADATSEELILLFQHPNYTNHNGGQLAFGPDGYLYIGTGDGGGGGDPNDNAQNPASLLGKILRIDPNLPPNPDLDGLALTYLPVIYKGLGSPGEAPNYRIPASNPFVGRAGYRPEIWAMGVRNPWRFSFDRQTEALWIGDVGQGEWEEVDFQAASSDGGENYGWNTMEGAHCYGSATCNQAGLTLPVWEYSHANDACSITGGYVYRGAAYPGLRGIYLYADWCNGRIWGLVKEGNTWQNHQFTPNKTGITSFGENEAGELFAVTSGDGSLYRIIMP